MTDRKIVIKNCSHCPLRSRTTLPVLLDGRTIYDTCRHPGNDGTDVSDNVIDESLNPGCPLEGNES